MISERSVLVIEDEPLVSMMLQDILTELGTPISAVVADISQALAAVDEGGFDVALLDMSLRGKAADPIASELKARHIPFAILSGATVNPNDFGAVVMVPKPYRFADIEQALLALDSELENR
jgi:CheY-like chemotaxis protein